ncbi:MAG: YcgN family cysteine cluster protein [Alphaproteobacteria bacterium]
MTAQSTSEHDVPFWQRLRLDEMSAGQWESLCDGCARCCLNKLEYEDTGDIDWTEIACHLLEDETCRCRDYENRHTEVPDCIALDAASVGAIRWLPPTCAYRLVAEGRDLYWWHPLVSGDRDTVHLAGISVRGRTLSEADVPVSLYDDHVVTWPNENPYDTSGGER